jgi:uncharacterized FAD-dependent dehydrogenase
MIKFKKNFSDFNFFEEQNMWFNLKGKVDSERSISFSQLVSVLTKSRWQTISANLSEKFSKQQKICYFFFVNLSECSIVHGVGQCGVSFLVVPQNASSFACKNNEKTKSKSTNQPKIRTWFHWAVANRIKHRKLLHGQNVSDWRKPISKPKQKQTKNKTFSNRSKSESAA